MAGWSGFKVPGHSGTEFKHRKVFAYRKQYPDKRSRKSLTADPNLEQKSYQYSRRQDFFRTLLKIVYSFTFLVLLLIGGIYFYKQFNNYEAKKNQAIEAALQKNRISEYQDLVNIALYYSNHQQLDRAQYYYTEALEIISSGEEAIRGLSYILDQQCLIHQRYCRDAERYQKYIEDSLDANLKTD